jgi:Ca2+-binding RTX toxin-like protein
MALDNFSNGLGGIVEGLAPVSLLGDATGEQLNGTDGGDKIDGAAGNDVIDGAGGDDTLTGGAGNDTLRGGRGNDIYIVDGKDQIVENVGQGVDEIVSSVSVDLKNTGTDIKTGGLGAGASNIENVTLVGSAKNATGNDLDNKLVGNAGANRLAGGAGNDTLIGGKGDDVYVVDVGNLKDGKLVAGQGDQIVELSGEGAKDTVETSKDFSLEALTQVENLTLTGDALVGIGNAAANTILGNGKDNNISGGAGNDKLEGREGNDILDGGEGNDIMIGGVGADTYIVDSIGDKITEAAPVKGGTNDIDTVKSSISFKLGANLEDLTLTGSANIDGIGNTLSNKITGNTGNNKLLGDAGDDVLDGGAGNDTLDGGKGNDQMKGGLGNDTFIIDSDKDSIEERVGGGLDTVVVSVDVDLNSDRFKFIGKDDNGNTVKADTIENVTLGGKALNGTGNALNNFILGNTGKNTLKGEDGDDTLDGGKGADTLTGGKGNDTLIIDDKGDVADGGEGIDTLVSVFDELVMRAGIENVTLTGSKAKIAVGDDKDNVLTGNALANTLTGNAGNDTLNGGSGADSMTGGTGNDVYIVDNSADKVVEGSDKDSGSADTVVSFLTSYDLGKNAANVENLILAGAAVAGIGSGSANLIIGNLNDNDLEGLDGDDTLDGGAGNDNLRGGKGNDTYVVDSLGDKVVEGEGADGIDTVVSSVSFDLSFEDGFLFDSPVIPIPGDGTLITIPFISSSGVDVIIGPFDPVEQLFFPTIENITLVGSADINATGNSLNNILTGNDGANRLEGGFGADTLIGGKGNDTYILFGKDTLIEEADAGIDTVVSIDDHALASNFENLTLADFALAGPLIAISTARHGIGNELDNRIIGNSLDNTLEGGAGADTLDGGVGRDALFGGTGNDTYVVGSAGDRVIELADEGIDTVLSSTDHSLAANVENLILDRAFNAAQEDPRFGVGNALDNQITARGAGDQVLIGDAGNDTLDGGQGADILIGGSGNDTYVVDNAGDQVFEGAGQGHDTVRSGVDFSLAQNAAELEDLELTGTAKIGAGNDFANKITGNDQDNLLIGGKGADTLIGGKGNDVYFVDSVDDVVLDTEGDNDIVFTTDKNVTKIDGIEHVIFIGEGGGQGNAPDQVLTVSIQEGVTVQEPANAGDTATVSITVSLSGPAPQGGVTIDFSVAAGSLGLDASDFAGGVFPSGTLTFPEGQTTATISFSVIGDAALESDETLEIHLSNPVFDPEALVFVDVSDIATVKILDGTPAAGPGDPPVQPVQLLTATLEDGVTVQESANAGELATISVTVTLSGPAPDGGVTMDFSVVAGSAGLDASDFKDGVFPSGSVTFDKGATTATIIIEVIGDAIDEIDETLAIHLSNPVVDPALATVDVSDVTTVNIVDQDQPAAVPTLQHPTFETLFSAPEANVGVNGEIAATTLTHIGDINGDGFDDFVASVVSISYSLPLGDGTYEQRYHSSRTAILLGSAERAPSIFDLTSTRENQISIEAPTDDTHNLTVSSLGDFNGDGIDDFAVLATPYLKRDESGVAKIYVIYGQTDLAERPINLDALTADQGFAIAHQFTLFDQQTNSFTAPLSVSSAGDVNGDGFADLIIGDGGFHYVRPGNAYVLFGHDSTIDPIETVSQVESGRGFRIDGVDPRGNLGRSVSSAGDLNGDGYDDLIVSAPLTSTNGDTMGTVYVIYGHAGSFADTISVGAIDGVTSSKIIGAIDESFVGAAITDAGDINGDGLSDVFFSAPHYTKTEHHSAHGGAYVVFGQSETFDPILNLGTLDGTNGFVIVGAEERSGLGIAITSAGDINGDGFDDVAVSADSYLPFTYESISRDVYIVFGQEGGFAPVLDLGSFDATRGIHLSTTALGAYSGIYLSGGHDIDGDGFDDLIIGGPDYSDGHLYLQPFNVGFVVYGGNFSGAVTHQGGVGADAFQGTVGKEVFVTGAGDDLVVGKGGNDVIRTGAGNDEIHVTDLTFERIDGGSGIDAVHFDLAGRVNLGDLDGNAHTANRTTMTDIEVLDFANGLSNEIVLSRLDLMALQASGRDFAGIAGLSHVVTIEGDAGDILRLSPGEGWTAVNATVAGYTLLSSNGMTIAVDQDVVIQRDIQVLVDDAVVREPELSGDTSQLVFSIRLDGPAPSGGLTLTYEVILGSAGVEDFAPGTALSGTVTFVEGSNIAQVVLPVTDDDLREFAEHIDIRVSNPTHTDPFARVVLGDDLGHGTIQDGLADLAGVAPAPNPGILDGINGFRIDGVHANDQAGFAVAGIGDINGDGFGDFAVGAPFFNGNDTYLRNTGATYVVFGKATPFDPSLSLDGLDGTNGFVAIGIGGFNHLGWEISAAGDINGDGIDDVVFGAPFAHPVGKVPTGLSFVMFGHEGPFNPLINVKTLSGQDGFRIEGDAQTVFNDNDYAGGSVSRAGDINGDGYEDIIVGAAFAEPNGALSGSSYVIFGHEGGFPAKLPLASIDGVNGFRLDGAETGDWAGISVSGGGDINGDGFADLIIGARKADANGSVNAGISYVYFGHGGAFDPSINLGTLDGSNGFALIGSAAGDEAGSSVSLAGDINGDGYTDLIVGAPHADPNGNASGASYVVFGHGGAFDASIDLDALDGTNGFRMVGKAAVDLLGSTVTRAGDVNGDGYDDLVVVARGAGSEGQGAATPNGEVYLVFGRGGSFDATLDLSTLTGANGFRLDGVHVGDAFGHSVDAAGDINGDGYADLIIGAPHADAGGVRDAGSAYVFYGGDFSGSTTHAGTVGNDTVTGSGNADQVVTGAGDDHVLAGTGADVVHTGAGNDVIEVTGTSFRHIDGGSGVDILRIDAIGDIDLGNLDGVATTSERGRITGIDILDITNGGSNELTLHLADLLAMAPRNKDTGGSADFDNVLRIDGEVGDGLRLLAGDGWVAFGGNAPAGYTAFKAANNTILVDTDLLVSVA